MQSDILNVILQYVVPGITLATANSMIYRSVQEISSIDEILWSTLFILLLHLILNLTVMISNLQKTLNIFPFKRVEKEKKPKE